MISTYLSNSSLISYRTSSIYLKVKLNFSPPDLNFTLRELSNGYGIMAYSDYRCMYNT